MAKAFQCDICGELFTHKRTYSNPQREDLDGNIIDMTMDIIIINIKTEITVDTCFNCIKDMMEKHVYINDTQSNC